MHPVAPVQNHRRRALQWTLLSIALALALVAIVVATSPRSRKTSLRFAGYRTNNTGQVSARYDVVNPSGNVGINMLELSRSNRDNSWIEWSKPISSTPYFSVSHIDVPAPDGGPWRVIYSVQQRRWRDRPHDYYTRLVHPKQWRGTPAYTGTSHTYTNWLPLRTAPSPPEP